MSQQNWREEARDLMSKADERIVADLMKGAIDLHVHSGPSTMPRILDHLEQVDEAARAGMRAVLFKDHYYSVAPFIPMMQRLTPHKNVEMFGSVVLNTVVGGLNPYAVDFNVKSGAKLVYMPTAHAANHIRDTYRSKRLASNVTLRTPYAITVLDPNGKLLDSVKEILDIVAAQDVILSSGHLHASEIWMLFEEARKRGVKKLLVNHPNFGLHLTLEDVAELGKFGAVLEQCAGFYIDCRFNQRSPQELRDQIDAAGVENSSLASDLGQVDNPTPVEGMRQMIRLCLGLGYTSEQIRLMVSANPARLLGIDPRPLA